MKLALRAFAWILVGGAAGAAHAQVYDGAADFKLNSNPNGMWSYWSQLPGFTPELMTQTSMNCYVPGLICRSRYAGFYEPQIGLNTTGAPIRSGSVVLPTGVLNMHPGPNGEKAIVKWTAPGDGPFNASGYFQMSDLTPTGVTVSVHAPCLGLTSVRLSRYGERMSFNKACYLRKGQAFTFTVNYDGNYANDSTSLKVYIVDNR